LNLHKFLRRIFLFCLILPLCVCKNAPEKPRNIILITIDTLRADALSLYGSKTPTPFMQQFSENAAVFERAFTTAPITLPAHVSLFTGLNPPAHGVRHNGVYRAAKSLTLLSEKARAAGFETGAFVGAAPVAAIYGLNQGFDKYDDSFQKAQSESGIFYYPERNAEQVRLAAQSWLSTQTSNKPFFLWLHLFDPHHPYETHGYSDLRPYEQEVAYTDHQLGEFFQFLKNRNSANENLIVITSDHGEAFGEHNEISHSLFVYNTTLRIPLMISGPGIKTARHKELVRIIDIYPTIVELMGWQPQTKIDGVSLVGLMQDKKFQTLESYSESFAPAIDFGWSPLACLQNAQFKYIHAPKPELYNLESDPSETKNLASSSQSEKYKRKVESLLASKSEVSEHNPSSEETERLRALGYVAVTPQKISWNAADPKDRVEVARQIAELTMKPMPLIERVQAYKQIVQMDPANPLLLLRYGEVLLQNKNYSEAEAMFQKTIDGEYPSAAPYNGLAAAYFYQGKKEEAENTLQKAVDAGVADGETYFNLAEILYSRGEISAAFTYYDRSTELGHKLAPLRKADILKTQ
jgi:arylsulfatase A-like enzyme